MPYEISKEFSFAYGHRVWSQELDPEFSDNLQCACRHLHGHEGVLDVTLTPLPGHGLERGMVTDFRHLSWLKKFIDDTLDHKFVIDRNDPLFDYKVPVPLEPYRTTPLIEVSLLRKTEKADFSRTVGYQVDPTLLGQDPNAEREYYESFFVVDFVPTSENFSKWIYDIIAWKMARVAHVVSVDWWESSKSHSKYQGN